MIKITLPNGEYIELTEEGALQVASQIHNQLYMIERKRQLANNKTYESNTEVKQYL